LDAIRHNECIRRGQSFRRPNIDEGSPPRRYADPGAARHQFGHEIHLEAGTPDRQERFEDRPFEQVDAAIHDTSTRLFLAERPEEAVPSELESTVARRVAHGDRDDQAVKSVRAKLHEERSDVSQDERIPIDDEDEVLAIGQARQDGTAGPEW
jgi:hypothetical protein